MSIYMICNTQTYQSYMICNTQTCQSIWYVILKHVNLYDHNHCGPWLLSVVQNDSMLRQRLMLRWWFKSKWTSEPFYNDHGYVPLVINTSQSFPHSWFITGFVTRLSRVEQELLTLPEHLSSPSVLSEVCVTRYLVLYVYFVRSFFVLL